MALQTQTREVAPLDKRAAFQPKSLNEENRTIDVTWTTGETVKRSGWDGPYNEALSTDLKSVRMGRLSSGTAPFLSNHDGGDIRSVLGVIETARLDSGIGTATVRFAKDDPDADAAWNKVRQGILPNVSVGYRVHAMSDVTKDGETVPTYRADDWEPYEVSLVPMGADSQAHVRSANTVERNTCVFTTRGPQPQKDANKMDPTEVEKAAAAAKAEAARNAEIEVIKAQALKDASARAAAINGFVRKSGLDASFADELIRSGKTELEARAALFDKLADKSAASPTNTHSTDEQRGSGIELTVEERDKSRRGAEAAMIQRYGMSELVQKVRAKGDKARPDTQEAFRNIATDGGEFKGMKPVRIAMELLERSGVNTRRMSDEQIIKRALQSRAGGQNTESDYSILLANLMYKQSLGQYELADDTWRLWCGTDTVQDFKPANRYRLGTFGVLDLMPEGSEYKSRSIPDGVKFAITVQTKGGMINISRQALIDDDMGAVLATAGEFGRSAGLTIETDAYALLNANSGMGPTQGDSNPFFYSGRGNVNATGSAIGVDALDSDRVQMAIQQDQSSNEFIALRPSVLLLPVGLGGKAKVINKMEFDNSVNVFQEPNKVQGLFRAIIDTPRLSGTRRYLFAEGVDAFKAVFLNGQQTPYMEERQEWRVDGVSWKLRIDFKVQEFDPKGAVTNAGA